MEPAVLLAFAGAWGALVVLPGPDTALTLKHALVGGRAPALRTALGSCTALTAHVLAAGLGLSAILAQSAAAFTVLKLVGAAYLAYLGLRLILARTGAPAAEADPAPPRRSASPDVQGLLTGLLNPKSALFFLTFLPQFLEVVQRLTGTAFVVIATRLAGASP